MVVSLVLHAILAVVALSFVAVTVITKNDQSFESRQVVRPRMPSKQLQVPVKIKKKQRTPKMRQRIVVNRKANRNMPDIKMPEISGIKGGIGAAGGRGVGHDGAGGIGFAIPEIEIFGIRSKGEKVFIALDSDSPMLRDERGGMLAYSIIKEELEKIVEGLGPTTLFNVAVFDQFSTTMLYPRMVPATRANTSRVAAWLGPLNQVKEGMKDDAYGTETLGKGGTIIHNDFTGGELKPVEWGGKARYWYTPAALAMQQQADTVFLLVGMWGTHRYVTGKSPKWDDSNRRQWKKCVRDGHVKLEKENAERRARNEPPRVVDNDGAIVLAYFPNMYMDLRPPEPSYYYYTPRDFSKSLYLLREENVPQTASKSGVSKRKKDNFSLNVVFFARTDNSGDDVGSIQDFKKLTSLCNGSFRSIAGLEAIKSYVSH